MKSKIFIVMALIGVLLVATASAGILDSIFGKKLAAGAAGMPVTGQVITARTGPTITPIDLRDVGDYIYSESGHALVAVLNTTEETGNQAIVARNYKGIAIKADTYSTEGVDTIRANAFHGVAVKGSSDYGYGLWGISKRSIAIYAQADDANQYAGYFTGGKGIFSRSGYLTNDASNREVAGVSGSYRTADGKTVTVTKGIITRIATA